MSTPLLTGRPAPGRVWRVGFLPEPWAWSGWEWASDGRFSGRWDDANGNFRTVYAGSSLLACLLEVLACFRADDLLLTEIAGIQEDGEDAVLYPTIMPGRVPFDWLDRRTAASADLAGTYCEVTSSESIAALRPRFIGLALALGLKDFDAAALKDARPRLLTQRVSADLYDATDFDGIFFTSRHGDNLHLWAIFERPGDPPVSPRLTGIRRHHLTPDTAEIAQAFGLLHLDWEEN